MANTVHITFLVNFRIAAKFIMCVIKDFAV